MKHRSSTNQPSSETLVSQETEVEGDSELSEIAHKLHETAPYAINPAFKDELHEELLQQFRNHHSKENK